MDTMVDQEIKVLKTLKDVYEKSKTSKTRLDYLLSYQTMLTNSIKLLEKEVNELSDHVRSIERGMWIKIMLLGKKSDEELANAKENLAQKVTELNQAHKDIEVTSYEIKVLQDLNVNAALHKANLDAAFAQFAKVYEGSNMIEQATIRRLKNQLKEHQETKEILQDLIKEMKRRKDIFASEVSKINYIFHSSNQESYDSIFDFTLSNLLKRWDDIEDLVETYFIPFKKEIDNVNGLHYDPMLIAQYFSHAHETLVNTWQRGTLWLDLSKVEYRAVKMMTDAIKEMEIRLSTHTLRSDELQKESINISRDPSACEIKDLDFDTITT